VCAQGISLTDQGLIPCSESNLDLVKAIVFGLDSFIASLAELLLASLQVLILSFFCTTLLHRAFFSSSLRFSVVRIDETKSSFHPFESKQSTGSGACSILGWCSSKSTILVELRFCDLRSCSIP